MPYESTSMLLSTFEVAFVPASVGIDHDSLAFLLAVDVPAFINISVGVDVASKSMGVVVLEVSLIAVTRLPNAQTNSVFDFCVFLHLPDIVVFLSVCSLGGMLADISQFFQLEVESSLFF